MAEERKPERPARPQMLQDADDIVATFKIEVTFGTKRSKEQSIGAIQIFESGAALHGGGDCKIFWCGYPDCERHLPYSSKAAGEPFCEHCHRLQRPEDLIGERFFRCSTKQLAETVELIYNDLGRDADIYLKYHPDDIRRATLDYVGTDRAVQLGKVRAGVQRPVVYPLRRIIKDTAAGAEVVKRFRAFLES